MRRSGKVARAVLCVCLAALLASSKACVRAQGEDDYEGAEGEDFFDGSENEGDFMDVGDPYGGYDEYGGDFMDGLGGGMGEEDEANPGDHIRGFLELDDLTFDKFVPSAGPALVEFYAPWCGHCRTLAQELSILGSVLGEHKRINLVKVNADEHRTLAERFNIEGFPTIKFVDADGSVEDVDGRSMEELAEFVWSKVGKTTFLPELEPHVRAFMEEEAESRRREVAERAEAAVEGLGAKEKEYGEVYLKVMKGILKKGDEYLEKERLRIHNMVENEVHSLTEDRIKQFANKIEILEVFAKMEL